MAVVLRNRTYGSTLRAYARVSAEDQSDDVFLERACVCLLCLHRVLIEVTIFVLLFGLVWYLVDAKGQRMPK